MTRSDGGQKAIFLKKNAFFQAENGIFLVKSFYSKFISDKKYIIYTFKKKFFFY